MIELTTGMVFLMSSLYGAGQANANLMSAAMASQASEQATQEASASSVTAQSAAVSKEILKDISNSGIEAYIREEYADTPVLIEIARCESRFHQFNGDGTVVRGIVNSKDVGIMQINEKYHAEDALDKGIDIYTVKGNVAFGKYLYEKYGTSPWNSSAKCWSAELAKK